MNAQERRALEQMIEPHYHGPVWEDVVATVGALVVCVGLWAGTNLISPWFALLAVPVTPPIFIGLGVFLHHRVFGFCGYPRGQVDV